MVEWRVGYSSIDFVMPRHISTRPPHSVHPVTFHVHTSRASTNAGAVLAIAHIFRLALCRPRLKNLLHCFFDR